MAAVAAVQPHSPHLHASFPVTPMDHHHQHHRSHRTVLPPLSSLSLPVSPLAGRPPSHSTGTTASSRPRTTSPRLHHPRPTHALSVEASVLTHPPPSPPETPAYPAPSPEVYARVYAALRERLAGCEDAAVRSAAELARGALEARRKSVEEAGAGNEEPPTKRRRSGGETGIRGHAVVEFYDNPPPALPEAPETEDDGQGEGKRRRPAPRLPPLSSLLPDVPQGRKRATSLPTPPSPSVPTRHLAHESTTVTSSGGHSSPQRLSPGPAPRQRPCDIRPHCVAATLPSSRSLPCMSLLPAGARRAEALHNVVRSFEAVRAVRAEGRRRSGLKGLMDGGAEGSGEEGQWW